MKIDLAIVKEARWAVTALERIADSSTEFGLGADLAAASLKEPIRVVDDRPTMVLANVATLISR